MAYTPGSTIQPIPGLIDCKTNEEVTLEIKEGQVTLIIFWASWCPPTIGTVAQFQKLIEKHGAVWGDKVRFIGISADGEPETVTAYINAKGLTSIEHLHQGESEV